MRSMTGYGAAGGMCGNTRIAVEVRTVNHRFLDPHIRLPREYLSLETEIQKVIRQAIRRGRVDVTVSAETEQVPDLTLNIQVARGYADAAAKLYQELNLPDQLDLRTLMLLPGVVPDGRTAKAGLESMPPELSACVLESVRVALENVERMRLQEGGSLRAEMLRHAESIDAKLKEVRKLAVTAVKDLRDRLDQRLTEVLGQGQVDPQRLAQEVAILAERSDFTEELARLESHLNQLLGLMDVEEVGKRMDFLLQEMQREANTILSKCADIEVSRYGIAVKADIEKLREQIQNVE